MHNTLNPNELSQNIAQLQEFVIMILYFLHKTNNEVLSSDDHI